jgi:hypothetical protein
MIVLIGTAAAFLLGFFIGFSTARNSLLADGMKKWAGDMSMPASVLSRPGNVDSRPGPVSFDRRGARD